MLASKFSLKHSVHVEIRNADEHSPVAKRARIISLLVEGMSLRASSRVADVSINTVTKLLCDVGAACAQHQDKAMRNLKCERLQTDEIWSFVYAKERKAKNVGPDVEFAGDVWTWTAIDADTKLIPCWAVGSRNAAVAHEFIKDLASRLANRLQLTTDGHRGYLSAVRNAFVNQIDYAMLIKVYGPAPEGDVRYSPTQVTDIKTEIVSGAPDVAHSSTSYVERSNLTMRMGMRRFTRLTNGFSKKVENHAHAVALHMMHYNFGRVHKTPRVTPAMKAGICDRVWSLQEIAALVVDEAPKKRGPYKKRAADH